MDSARRFWTNRTGTGHRFGGKVGNTCHGMFLARFARPANEKPPLPVLAGATVKTAFSVETTLPPQTRKNKAPATS